MNTYDYINKFVVDPTHEEEPFYTMIFLKNTVLESGIIFKESAWRNNWFAFETSRAGIFVVTKNNDLLFGQFNIYMFLGTERPLQKLRINAEDFEMVVKEFEDRAADILRGQIDVLRLLDHTVMYTGSLAELRMKTSVPFEQVVNGINSRVLKLAKLTKNI